MYLLSTSLHVHGSLNLRTKVFIFLQFLLLVWSGYEIKTPSPKVGRGEGELGGEG